MMMNNNRGNAPKKQPVPSQKRPSPPKNSASSKKPSSAPARPNQQKAEDAVYCPLKAINTTKTVKESFKELDFQEALVQLINSLNNKEKLYGSTAVNYQTLVTKILMIFFKVYKQNRISFERPENEDDTLRNNWGKLEKEVLSSSLKEKEKFAKEISKKTITINRYANQHKHSVGKTNPYDFDNDIIKTYNGMLLILDELLGENRLFTQISLKGSTKGEVYFGEKKKATKIYFVRTKEHDPKPALSFEFDVNKDTSDFYTKNEKDLGHGKKVTQRVLTVFFVLKTLAVDANTTDAVSIQVGGIYNCQTNQPLEVYRKKGLSSHDADHGVFEVIITEDDKEEKNDYYFKILISYSDKLGKKDFWSKKYPTVTKEVDIKWNGHIHRPKKQSETGC